MANAEVQNDMFHTVFSAFACRSLFQLSGWGPYRRLVHLSIPLPFLPQHGAPSEELQARSLAPAPLLGQGASLQGAVIIVLLKATMVSAVAPARTSTRVAIRS
jgi:hypothetical protein